MAAIFLSYSRDDRVFAEALASFVEQAGHHVWWDRNIDSGSEFSDEIEAALEKADVVLVAWSRSSGKSAWVRDEAAIGRDSGRLVPILIDRSQPPLGFRQFQALDLTGWKGRKKDPRSTALLGVIDRRAKGKIAPAVAPAESKRAFARPRGKNVWIVASAILVLLALAGTGSFLLRRGEGGDRTTKPTMALVPFTTRSGDPGLHDVATQTRDALSHTLSQSGIPVRLLDSAPANSGAGGDFLITGEVSRNADQVVATVHLAEATHGVTVYSKRFEARPEQLRDFPERIGAQMAGFLSNGVTLLALDRRHPVDPGLLTELLADSDDQLQNYQKSKRVAAKAPDVPSAQLGVAFFTGFVLDQLPPDERRQAVAEARQAADRGLALAPEFGDTYAAWCLLHSDARLIECENHMRAGNRIDQDAPYLRAFLAAHLREVGRVDEALDLTRLSYTHDPYNSFKISDMLRMFEASGDSDAAGELYEDGVRWWPEGKGSFFRARIFGLIDRADFERMRRVEQEVGASALAPGYPLSGPIAAAVKSKSAPALHRACAPSERFVLVARCMIAFSAIGDLDSAYAIADKIYPRRLGRTPAETEAIWLSDPSGIAPLEFVTSAAAAPMRRDPRYIQLAQRVGLLDYWRSGRLPDFCRKNPEPVCRQLLASNRSKS